MNPVNVMVVDSNTLFRQGLPHLLPAEYSVAGDVREHRDAVRLIEAGTDVQLVLLDCPAASLREAVAELRRAAPGALVVHLSDTASVDRLRAALDADVSAYITKDRSAEALVQQLHLVMMGEKVFPSGLVQELLRDGAMAPAAGPKGLSPRETQILRGLMRGHSNKAIAITLHITEATVKVHLKGLLRKLNLSNRTQAAIWGTNNGIEPVAAAA
ncbi:MAG TPA: response regulator transcription factor [Azospirillaceae bacterium]|nr:response regulator transcription factor [Azospirillaceae bacterium]